MHPPAQARLENRFQEAGSEKESLVACGSWAPENEISLVAYHQKELIRAKRIEQQLVLQKSDLSKLWLKQKTPTLNISWQAKSKDFSAKIAQTLNMKPTAEWLCSILSSEELRIHLQRLPPSDSFSLSQKTSCQAEVKQVICKNALSLAKESQYNIQTVAFKHQNGSLKLDQVERYIEECGNEETWSKTFSQGVSTLIDKNGGLVEIGEFIDTHDSFISTRYSGKMKQDLLRYSFRGILDRYDREEQLYLLNMLLRYIDDPGISSSSRRRYQSRIRNRLEDSYQSCSDIWPSPTAPCLESFLKLITNSNEARSFYLKEQFNTCAEEDMQLNQLCIFPHMQQ